MLRQLFLAVFALSLTPAAAPVYAEFPRIRVLDAATKNLFTSGYAKSPTFRDLVHRLEQSDVIVHIEPWPPLRYRGRIGGLLRFVARARGFRYLRITLGVQLPHDTAVALLGHELQHALEVANDASAVDDFTFETPYRRIGDMRPDARIARSYDTPGAREVERRIGAELRELSRRTIAHREPIHTGARR